MSVAIAGLCVALAGIFVAAATHKLATLWSGDADLEPLLRSGWRRSAATPLLALAALCELSVAAALVVGPLVGLVAATGLLTVYTAELRRLPPEAPCGCLGAVASARHGFHRNIALVVTTLASAATIGFAAVSVQTTSAAALGAALTVLAIPSALAVLRAGGMPFRLEWSTREGS